MLYSAELYLGCTAEEAQAPVDNLLKKMGLESCADTKVGNQFLPGMSGGQKRRLSIAMALIKQPRIIFMVRYTSPFPPKREARRARENHRIIIGNSLPVVSLTRLTPPSRRSL